MNTTVTSGITPTVIERMENWLLKSGVQLTDGPEAGGVAGWLNDDGTPEYVYMEITGYYLSSMAFIISKSEGAVKADALDNAQKALDWLQGYYEKGELPPTRKFLRPEPGDWRNTAIFAFDIGMVIRGLVDISQFISTEQHKQLLGFFLTNLAKLIAPDFSLNSHYMTDPNAPAFPPKWSTTHGPYHLKVVSPLLNVPAELLTEDLQALMAKVYDNWKDYCEIETLTEDLHPTFYYLEGQVPFALRNYEPGIFEKMEILFTKIMAHQKPDGWVPYNPATADDVMRADINAQALRIGAILKSQGFLKGAEWDTKLHNLAEALLRFTNDEGAISFHPLDGAHPKHWNAWCAEFTQQAVCFYKMVLDGQTISNQHLDMIV